MATSPRRPLRALPLLGLLAATALTAAACKPSKKAKCEKIVNDAALLVESLGKAFGQADAKMSDAEKKEALDKCIATPDDELECATNPSAAKDAKCVELQKKKAHTDFESATVDGGKIKAQVPKGWEHKDFMGDQYSPKDGGFMTSYRISHTCGGACEAHTAAEWEKIIGDEIASFKDPNAKVSKDEKPNATTRVIISDQGADAKELTVTMWKEGASFYVKCDVRLDAPYDTQIDAFEKACLASEPSWEEKK